jgi:hypothetical protein
MDHLRWIQGWKEAAGNRPARGRRRERGSARSYIAGGWEQGGEYISKAPSRREEEEARPWHAYFGTGWLSGARPRPLRLTASKATKSPGATPPGLSLRTSRGTGWRQGSGRSRVGDPSLACAAHGHMGAGNGSASRASVLFDRPCSTSRPYCAVVLTVWYYRTVRPYRASTVKPPMRWLSCNVQV